MSAEGEQESGWARRAQVLGLLVLSPVCAEYLSAYDETTGDVGALLAGLLFFIPLYGCPALLIREVARRAGMTWVGIVALSAGFGIVQAGLVDQSLFRTSYRDIPEWADWAMPTYVDSLGFSAYLALIFVAGHVIWSFGVPIAIVEALGPERRDRPWLGPVGAAIVAVLYLVSAALILGDHLKTESAAISPTQLVVTSLLVAALVAVAFTVGRARQQRTDRLCPAPWLLGIVVLAAGFGQNFLPVTWPGVLGLVLVLGGGALVVLRFSRSAGWTRLHEVAVAGGLLLAMALVGLVTEPLLGEVSAARKYAHNLVLLATCAGLVALAARRTREQQPVVPT